MVYSALLALCGGLMLFAPELLASDMSARNATASDAVTPMLAQLVAAAMLAFAAANWTARTMVLGGIYGRAIVVGNQTFAFIGAMIVIRQIPPSPTPLFWFLVLTIVFGAVLFSVLMFRPSWLEKAEK